MIGINRLLWNWHRQRLPVRARTLLFLEHLETRALPASVFVVPTAAPLDAAHFHTLSDACTAAGAGGTVTVEPGSGDSNTVENVSITEPGITVQGVSYENTPGGYFDVTVRAESVSIINLKVSVTFGSGFGHTTIKRCETGVLTQLASPAGNGADVITQNTIRGTLLLAGTANDVISYNRFSPVDPGFLWGHHAPVLGLSNAYGTLIESNTFDGSYYWPQLTLFNADVSQVPVVITDNLVAPYLGATTPVGIALNSGNAIIRNNRLDSSNRGTALDLFDAAYGPVGTGRILVEGNDFHHNLIGISVHSPSSLAQGSFALDLGGGSLGSRGGNNFRGFRGKATAMSAGIDLETDLHSTLAARNNIFTAGLNPTSVVFRAGPGIVDVSAPLSESQAFVQTLYQNLLDRTGTLLEIGDWVNALNSNGREFVVQSILRSSESSARIVNRLYIDLLGRTPDASGWAGWTEFLHAGGTIEQVEAAILASPEYFAANYPNWTQSLYQNVLRRPGSLDEVTAWNSAGPTLGLSAIAAAFLDSVEARSIAVQNYYSTFLHRWLWVGANEVVALAASPGDRLAMETFILSSEEYWNNG